MTPQRDKPTTDRQGGFVHADRPSGLPNNGVDLVRIAADLRGERTSQGVENILIASLHAGQRVVKTQRRWRKGAAQVQRRHPALVLTLFAGDHSEGLRE